MLSFINRVSSRSSRTDVTTKKAEEVEHPAQPPEPEVTPSAPGPATDDAAPIPEILEPEVQRSVDGRPSVSIYSSDGPQPTSTPEAHASSAALSTVPATEVSHDPATELLSERPPVSPSKQRRISWRPLSFKFLNSQDAEEHKPALSLEKEQKKKLQVEEDREKRVVRISSADKKAKESAVIVRSLIVGPHGILPPNAKAAKPISKPKIEKVKSQLLNPKTANRVIAQLRALPIYAESLQGKENGGDGHIASAAAKPIHAVCLPLNDTEAEEKHFSKLKESASNADLGPIVSVYNSSLAELHNVFSQINAVSLLTEPNLGLGEPGDGNGILSGALPTAKTVIDGIVQVTPQLMGLGYATGKSLLPDHTGVHPPTDRMSVLTYWWGFELTLPPPSMKYLSNAPSIAHNLINVLTALSAVNDGVREILPFVRYISQYVDSEFNMIQAQDQGKGVVCAATWLVPVALVPRPWDFAPASTIIVQPAPADSDYSDHEATKPADPSVTSPPHSPPMPPSRPSSPPTLLPPLELHSTGFGESEEPDKAPPIDDTPVELDGDRTADMDISASTSSVPGVTVVPPTPTASGLSRSSGETMATEKA